MSAVKRSTKSAAQPKKQTPNRNLLETSSRRNLTREKLLELNLMSSSNK